MQARGVGGFEDEGPQGIRLRAYETATMAARPTGTVTLLFSDIEGSTARWDGAPAAMELALDRHDTLLRGAIEAHDGYVFKTIGDAFCAAFARAADALAAALDAQQALAAEDFSAVAGIRVRMALHTGACAERHGDYFGTTVNRVARLLAVGHGGQVLVSGASAEALECELPSQASLRDLGDHRLKDLAQPERVYQLFGPGLPDAFPELRSLDHLSNNLPAQATSFVGREGVVAEIKALLEHHRLVTLVGTGGAGKTRCAIQVGAQLLDECSDGVWFAELAPISDRSLVTRVIARALNVQEAPNRPILDTLLAYLKRKCMFLIIDNCEHVIEEARHVVAAILHGSADVRILTTSRERLNVSGEQVYRMPSLSVPLRSTRPPSSQDVLAFGAPLLFADRAASVDKQFALNDENAPYVAEICRRLDGIPLAIELAAARANVLSPKRLARMLDERFRVLTGGDRSALPRHRTMWALIDWSYDLLPVDERALFRKLAAFAGGFTLELATAVCGDEAIDEITMLESLSSLADKSLVQADPSNGTTRYSLLESTRQYAREQLAREGEYERVARAHAEAFVAWAERSDEVYETTSDRTWLAQTEPELENVRAALAWTLGASGDVRLGQRLAAAMRIAWGFLSVAEGRHWVHVAQQLCDAGTPPATLAALDYAQGHLASAHMQYKVSLVPSQRALTRYKELGDPLRLGRAQWSLGRTLLRLGRIEEAQALFAEALTRAQEIRAPKLTTALLGVLSSARAIAGDFAEARRLTGKALSIARACGAERSVAVLALNLGEQEFRAGDAAVALELARESLAAERANGALLNVVTSLTNIAAYLLALHRFDEARAAACEALVIARDVQHESGVGFALQHLAASDVLRPNIAVGSIARIARAARLLGYVDAHLAALETLREHTERQEYEAILAALSRAFASEELRKLMEEGGAWSEDEAVTEALLI
jgi:predicted ATPase/class 3 adenylate cyclase